MHHEVARNHYPHCWGKRYEDEARDLWAKPEGIDYWFHRYAFLLNAAAQECVCGTANAHGSHDR